jgi:hypothetical protein
MLDTGSTLGLLFKTSDLKSFPERNFTKVIGRGLNGDVVGIDTQASKLLLHTFVIEAPAVSVISNASYSYSSVGMDVMKNYTVVLNYCKAYAGFKKKL